MLLFVSPQFSLVFLFSMCRCCTLELAAWFCIRVRHFFPFIFHTFAFRTRHKWNIDVIPFLLFKERFGSHLQLLRFECLQILIFIFVSTETLGSVETRKILFLHQHPISAAIDWFYGENNGRVQKWFISMARGLELKFLLVIFYRTIPTCSSRTDFQLADYILTIGTMQAG